MSKEPFFSGYRRNFYKSEFEQIVVTLGPCGELSFPLISPSEEISFPKTYFQFAARDGNIEKCKTFMDNPTEIKAINAFGYTALHFAAENGRDKVCELLIPKMSNESSNSGDHNEKTD